LFFMGARALKRRRQLAGLSQHALARRAGVKFSRLHYAESGRIRLSNEEFLRVENALNAELGRKRAAIAKALIGGTKNVA
jgi:transcriptional regulator with XRE-family HTH domain